MTYEGDILHACPADLDFTNTWAVVVSGATWNPCGHMLLCCGTSSANVWYLHVAGQGVREVMGVWAYPKFMRGEANFRRYLLSNGKHELRRYDVKITDPAGAYAKLMEYMSDKWFWGVLPHNCAAFTTGVIEAGGGQLGIVLNCPDQEFVKKTGAAIKKGVDAAAKGMVEAARSGFLFTP